MDVDTLVRHQPPVVMVVGNNGIWGLETRYGSLPYDVAAGCVRHPTTRSSRPSAATARSSPTRQIGAALDRAFASGTPYLVNVLHRPAIAYPRGTTGIRPVVKTPTRVPGILAQECHRVGQTAFGTGVGQPARVGGYRCSTSRAAGRATAGSRTRVKPAAAMTGAGLGEWPAPPAAARSRGAGGA